jgi:hypothetical protein
LKPGEGRTATNARYIIYYILSIKSATGEKYLLNNSPTGAS